MPEDELTASDLVPLTTYSPWLDSETRKAVRELKCKLEKGIAVSATARAKSKPAPAAEKKRKLSSQADVDALQAARELLGRRKKA
eukprot:897693-Amphidinium_carterae.1